MAYADMPFSAACALRKAAAEEIERLTAEVAHLTSQRDLSVKTLAEAKSNLMHHRRFGIDTLQAWKNAATRTEGDIEEALATIRES